MTISLDEARSSVASKRLLGLCTTRTEPTVKGLAVNINQPSAEDHGMVTCWRGNLSLPLPANKEVVKRPLVAVG
ncbi:hypothetical protein ACROYT_G013493 [Oculina patagonica]